MAMKENPFHCHKIIKSEKSLTEISASKRMNIKEKAAKTEVLILDVDGVLTTGEIILDNHDNEWKFFNCKDGMGVTIAREAGIKIGILTGRTSSLVARRARELKMDIIEQGHFFKVPALTSICKKLNITPDVVTYMGDDLLDVNVMKTVGFSAAPADAHDIAKANADLVTAKPAGKGAVRELIDFILDAKGIREEIYERFLQDETV
jgi:3-deoxy-D-manno-octulosonate 8-phosphate phosphatase (KDO 8-P phosphatase)